VVDFRNTVVIMTSNVGADALKYQKNLGFNVGGTDTKYKDMKGTMLEELKKAFRPEFLNRIDEMIVFHSLEKEHLKEIVAMMANSLTKRLKEQDISLELTDSALEKIAEEGYDPQYGARPLRRSLQKQVEDRLSEELLKGNVEKGNQVIIDYVNDEFVVKKKEEVSTSK